jgi:hypothetical protein
LDDETIEGELSFVKADIEGGELLAFRGARGLLERDRPTVVAEINPWFLDGFGQRVEDLTEFFAGLGYELLRLVDGRLRPVSASEVEEDNYVFVHPSRRDRLGAVLTSRS